MGEVTTDFYQSIVNEVVENMRQQFINDGVSEDILEKLKKNWESKLQEKMQEEQEKFSFNQNQYYQSIPNQYYGAFTPMMNYPPYSMPYNQHLVRPQQPYGFQGITATHHPLQFGNNSAFTATAAIGKREEPNNREEDSNDFRKVKRQRTS